MLYGEGISKEGSLLDLALERDIIHKSGAWFSYKDQRIGQGRENTRKFLKENPDVAEEIDAIIRAELMATKGDEAPAEADGDAPEAFDAFDEDA